MPFMEDAQNDEPLEPGTHSAVLRSIETKETPHGKRQLWVFGITRNNPKSRPEAGPNERSS